jgi:hypothetical protein
MPPALPVSWKGTTSFQWFCRGRRQTAAFVHDLALVTLRDYHHSRERRHHDDPLDLGLGARPEDVHGARHGRSQQLNLGATEGIVRDRQAMWKTPSQPAMAAARLP